MRNKKLKYIIAIILIILFTFSVVPKSFQNDTFYVIELGRSIIENGVDWQDHYSIHNELEYRYPHWAFDVINSIICNFFGFTGIYVFTQILASIFVLLVFWNMLRKEINFNLAFISTLIVAYMMKGGFYARGQIISYSIFLLEFMILENFVERPTFFKSLALFVLSVLMANMHSTAWIIMLILVLPFIGEQVVYFYSFEGINARLLRKYNREYKKAKEAGCSQEELDKIQDKIKYKEKFEATLKEEEKITNRKIITKRKQNIKYIWIAFLVLIAGALITPIKLTPLLYFLKISLGNSMSYINEHMPIVPANSLEFLTYTIVIVALLGFTNSKLKLYDAFLILGLYLMALSGRRSMYLLIGLTAGIVVKMIDDFINDNIKNKNEKATKFLFIVTCIISVLVSIYMFWNKRKDTYVINEKYPISATKFIKENLDYKNIRMYNQYEFGSYLLMEGVPVLIDSRCDLYTPEFNKNVTVFDDYMEVQFGQKTIFSLMDKYKLDYAIVPVNSFEDIYMKEDSRFTKLYKDKYFIVYKYEK